MTSVNENKLLRCAGLNTTNQRGDDVSGCGTGGIDHIIIAFENHFQVVNSYNGVVRKTYYGDDKLHVGKPVGHTKPITSLFYTSNRVYT